MSRNSSGTYTLPVGNPVVSGTVIEANWANSTLDDISAALTDSLSRSGNGGMSASLRIIDGTVSVPGWAFGNETGSGAYRSAAGDWYLTVLGNNIARFRASGVSVTGDIGATTATISGNATIGGTLSTGALSPASVAVTGNATVGGTLGVTGVATLTANPVLSAGTANGVAYLNGSKVLTTGSALTFDGTNLATTGSVTSAGASNSGNLTFTGTGNRITGDFTNATQTNRVMFQTSTANSATLLGVIPSGTGNSSGLYIFNDSGFSNCARFDIGLLNSGSEARLSSTVVGSGGYVPMTFLTGGSERMRIDSSGNVGIGTSSPSFPLDVTNATNDATVSRFVGKFTNGTGTVALATFQRQGGAVEGAIRYNDPTTAIQFGTTTSHSCAFITNGTERMRIDSNGKVGIGTSSPANPLDVTATASTNSAARSVMLARDTSAFAAGVGGGITFGAKYNTAGSYFDAANIKGIKENATDGNAAGALVFSTQPNAGSPTERMRIDSSGNLLVGTTSASGQGGLSIYPNNSSGSASIVANRASTTASSVVLQLQNASTVVGSIQYTNTATAYNTSSDYRLKENIQPMQGALAVVQQLNPVTYKWKADGSDGQGFIAHELQAVVPDCVTGEKDAVDEEGKPVYQGIDTSFLVATLTKAIQELKAELDATKAEVAKLKAAAK